MCKLAKTTDAMVFLCQGSFNVGLSVTTHEYFTIVPNFAHVVYIPVRVLKINGRKDVLAVPFADSPLT